MNVAYKDLDRVSVDLVCQYLKCHPKASGWALLDEDNKVLWKCSVPKGRSTWSFFHQLFKDGSNRLYKYKWPRPHFFGKGEELTLYIVT